MSRYLKIAILPLVVFFVLPLYANANEVLRDNIENTPLGLIGTTEIEGLYGTWSGNEYTTESWSEIISSNCYSGTRCLETNEHLVSYTFSNEVTSFLNTKNERYLSFYIYFPYNEIDIEESVTSWNYLTLQQSGGGSDVIYFHFCKESKFYYSLVASDNANAINNCDNETYGEKIGTGRFGSWERVLFVLNEEAETLKYKLSESDWSVGIDINTYSQFVKLQYRGWPLYGEEDVYYGDNYEKIRIDDIEITDFDTESPFELEYYYSTIDESYSEEDTGCDVWNSEYCAIASSSPAYAMAIQAIATSTINDWKFEYLFTDLDGNVFEPQYLYGQSTNFPFAWTYPITRTIIFPEQTRRIYLLTTCLARQVDFPIAFGSAGTVSLCNTNYIGNGYTQDELFETLVALGKIASSSYSTLTKESAWIESGCDDIGVTDVFLGVKCALIWGFSPSDTSLQKFNTLKNNIVTIYPIGYATFIFEDFSTALSTTTTEYFDNDINIGAWFGTENATVTIDTVALLEHQDMASKLVEWLELLMWLGFIAWLFVWGSTRTL